MGEGCECCACSVFGKNHTVKQSPDISVWMMCNNRGTFVHVPNYKHSLLTLLDATVQAASNSKSFAS